jgi:hypothetical protein
MVYSTTAGFSAMEVFDNGFTNISGLDSNFTSYQQCGGAKKVKKAKKTKKNKKTTMRKPLSKKSRQLSKLRLQVTKKRTKRLENRLNQRYKRKNIVDSLMKGEDISNKNKKELSPKLNKFLSNIPKTSESKLSSWPSIEGDMMSTREKKFIEARKGLQDILKKKPVYSSKSKSVVKFSDYKKPLTKEKAALIFKSKKKGNTR